MTEPRWRSEFTIRKGRNTSSPMTTTYTRGSLASLVVSLVAAGWVVETQYEGHITLTYPIRYDKVEEGLYVFTFHRI